VRVQAFKVKHKRFFSEQQAEQQREAREQAELQGELSLSKFFPGQVRRPKAGRPAGGQGERVGDRKGGRER